MKKVLDGCSDGEVVLQECGPGQGCGNGQCVDACASAEMSKGSVGCSFWTLPPEDGTYGHGSCFAAMIANTWDQPVTIEADFGSDPLALGNSLFTARNDSVGRTIYTPLAGPLPAGEVAIVFLSQGPKESRSGDSPYIACPSVATAALARDPLDHATALTKAFRLKTSAPVSAYSIFPYGGSPSYIPSATLLLPVSSWGTNYVAVSAGKVMKAGSGVAGPDAKTTLQIVANEDDTRVRMLPVADVAEGAGVAGAGANVPQTWILSRGQVLQLSQVGELTGSPIESNKPIGMFGGTECVYIPSGFAACDTLQQQIPPLSQWGSDYALVPFRPRIDSHGGVEAREYVPYRLVGAVDNTKLTYDPAPPAGAPEWLSAGQVVNFISASLVTVKSQDSDHPFYAGVYMTGGLFNTTHVVNGGASTSGSTSGDPDFVNVVPSEQFLDHYVFFADYTYPETSLTVVRRKTARGFLPVELDCAGELEGFQPLGTSGEYEFAWVVLTARGVNATFPRGECSLGRHEAKSDGPFSVTVWGTGDFASYGYAAGMGSRPLNTVVAPVIR
ncbi:hypothetical protein AKJ09_06172 [Labilithrix luteola]|uniref:IgGFc-binding protein N-terminal domain-containing protein n=1 Tax=Labilithrix luteola TaxID=1391654 RepID=A0A0K1Q147_9BACT|nr:hypothetical protein AKJ09_06172 [Labilithrix luteola]